MNNSGILSNKQRGIYSEIIIPDNSTVYQNQIIGGPDQSLYINTQQRQKIPKASALSKKGGNTFNLNNRSSNKRKTMEKLQKIIVKIGQEDDFDLRVEPKVMEPYDPIPGRVPRKVAIDRKKKQYASFSIDDLLAQKGIDFAQKRKQSWIPLHYFDDSTFDDFSNEGWIEKKIDQDGNNRRLTGKGLRLTENGYEYEPIQVINFKPQSQQFTIIWKQDKKMDKLRRIYICFDAQDPRKYAQRLQNAVEQRVYADSLIRYEFLIDNMPLTNADLPQLDQEQKRRLQNMAKTKKIKDIQCTGLLMEVGYDYSRTMNKIIFNKFMEQENQEIQSLNLVLPFKKNKQVREFGMIQYEKTGAQGKQIVIYGKTPTLQDAKDFDETFKSFCFHSLFIKTEVVKALQDIRVKCNDVLDMSLFDLKLKRKLVLDQFKSKQQSSITQMLYHLKGAWIQDLIKVIKSNFSMVGKGWFNMQQTSKITYDFGKLKRFLTVVRLMMQDTILTVVKRCFYEFKDYIFNSIPKRIVVKNACQVTNYYLTQSEEKSLSVQIQKKLIKQRCLEPLFYVDLVKTKDDDFGFSTNPEKFVSMVRGLFEKPFEDLAKIPDLEPKILSDLYKAIKNEAFIKTPIKPAQEPVDPDPNQMPRKLPDQNKWIWFLIREVQKFMQNAIQPLYEYKKSWIQYIDLLKIDPDEFTRKIEMDDNPWEVDQIQAQISQIIKKDKTMREKLPENIKVSIFQISCKQMKQFLSQKYQCLQKNLIDMIAKKAKSQAQAIFTNFQQMQLKLKQMPKDIQKLTQIREYIANLPLQLQKMKIQMNKCFETYKILQDFNYRFNKDELDKKWIIFGNPKELIELVQKRNKELQKEKSKFLQQMKLNQQQFKQSIDNLERTILNFHSYQDINKHQDVCKSCIQINKSLSTLQDQARKFNSRQNLFDMEMTDYNKIAKMVKEFTPYSNLWITAHNWFQNYQRWMNGEWATLDAVAAQKFVEESVRILAGVNRFFKERDIQAILKIGTAIKAQLDQFKPKVPLMVALRKKGMQQRHWDQISSKVGFEVLPNEEFTFKTALQMGLMKFSDICVQIGQRASKQYNIQMGLNEMEAIWAGINFNLMPYKSTFLIKNYDDIQMVLDQHIVNTQSMQFSPFKKPFEERIIVWNNKLKIMSDVLEEWAKCQGQWMYLQPIFDSADIAKQLVQQSKKFKTVDSTWKHTMQQANKGILVIQMCSQDGLLQRLQEANKNLQTIQKELRTYLQKKRQKFARFYFLSDTDLLEILSQTKQPLAVQPHLKKVFENINEVKFDKDKKILSMKSAEKEEVPFVKHVDPNKKNVEDWMGQLQNMMRMSVRQCMINAVQDYPKQKRAKWSISHCGQVILNGSQIIWTSDVQKAFKNGVQGIKDYWQILNGYLLDLVDVVRTKLSVQAKVTINALIVIDVHAKDIVEKLWRSNISDINAFEWISQLRYYWTDDCYVKCIQTNFPYGYQYLGNTLRLVITPLTDKCYMTLMGALKLNLGGAPAGPAGTGKTQSVKDLAKALAKQCVVFNCSDSMDYIMIGKFFKGLASAGAWCCFDQFNRINIEVLSVIAQQLLILFGEKAKGTPVVQFEGSVIKLLPTFCVFITMNPGYAGRTQLPDNLKALFRAVAMMVPDYAMIGQIMLYSFGFIKGRELSKKMVATFKLSSEQLSSQDHYDYGMRAVRSVINAAGLLKSAEPDMDEQQLLLRALRDVNVPKFLKDDLPLFENIIQDLFPGIQKPKVDYGKLVQAVSTTAKKNKLQPCKPFIEKIMQLYDTIQVRHGLMLVGPTGGGKTSVYKCLAGGMTSLAKQGQVKVHLHVLNPKSIKIPSQLYGDYNESTHEWSDGILAYTVRQCVKDQSTQRHWIMFDGPVDALWIQSMNTVLDDNKKLCLNSGQILTLTPHMTMMFEVEDLAVASPATVSRCGMVYIEPQALGTQVLFDSWYQSIPANISSNPKIMHRLKQLKNIFIEPIIRQLRIKLKQVVATMDNNICQSLMRIIDSYFVLYTETQIKKISMQQMVMLQQSIENIYIFAVIWSLCCTTTAEGRTRFNQLVRKLIRDKLPHINFPEAGNIYNYKYSIQDKAYSLWEDMNKNSIIDSKLLYHQIMIPTSDSARNIYFLKLLICNEKHVMNCGPTGTGKSLNIAQLLNKQLGDDYQYISMVFSAQTGCNQTQDTIDVKLDKLRKGVYGPPIGKKCIIFVDDLNMPKKEQFGAQPPIELIRQYLDHKGWYNRKDLQWMKLQRLICLAAMGPPGGGRTFITARLVRHFNVIAYTELDKDIIYAIFNQLMSNFYRKFSQPVRNAQPEIIDKVLKIYQKVRQELLPTPSKSHYTFNLRDIWRVFQGLCSGAPKQILEVKDLLRLWYHENMRVFHDRLTTTQDRIYLTTTLSGYFKDFGYQPEQILNTQRVLFGDFTENRDSDNKLYVQIDDLPGLVHKMDGFQQQYNNDITFIINGARKQMRLVMFLDAAQHVTRIARIIRQPQGNALVLGVGGSGRQSLSRMATYLTGYKLFQIEVTKSYNMRSWRDDIKKILLLAGVENKPITFLFCDTQIINQQMLEDINNILNSGDVTGIYQQKDMQDITSVCKGQCVRKNIPPTKSNIFAQYLIRVKRNIHMNIVMSPLASSFATRLRMFPSLINCSTIDWFTQWPEQALINVGKGQFIDDQQQLGLQGIVPQLVEMFKNIHKSVQHNSVLYKQQLSRYNYVTPTSYLQLLTMYKQILSIKKKQVTFLTNRLRSGLDKLESANKQVEEMKIQLRHMQPQLEKKNKEVIQLMESLERDQLDAKQQQAVVAQEQQKASIQSNKAKTLAQEAQKQCADAQKSLDQTLQKVKDLKKEHLNEIKGFNNPSDAVVVVCTGLVILFWDWIMANGGQIIYQKPVPGAPAGSKKQQNFFQMCRKFLMKDLMGLIKMIQLYDKNNISDRAMQRLKQKVIFKPEFEYEKVALSSFAAKYLQMWVKCMYQYNIVYTQTQPLRRQLAILRKTVQEKLAYLRKKKSQLQQINAKIDLLQKKFTQSKKEQQDLKNKIQECEIKLQRAQKLTQGLSQEKIRWANDIKVLELRMTLLPGDSIISAGMISYAGAFTSTYRQKMEKEWRQKLKGSLLPHTEGINMRGFLGQPVKIQAWNIAQLPKDDNSTENGIIIDKTRRWPLMIDPQNQANKFIKNLSKQHPEGIDVVKLGDTLMRTLELAVQYGKWVLLEGVQKQLDASLDPILQQEVVKSSGSDSGVIQIGDKSLSYNNAFKFFMMTTLSNPHYSPQTFVKVTIINFAITPSGLEEQMLAQIVTVENPNLQQKKTEIVKKNAADKKQLLNIEDSILKSLSETKGGINQILMDETLINKLQSSKKFAAEINQRVKDSKITEAEIDKARQSYRPVAFRASLLYFCILDLSGIDPMYQYSLQWFSTLFLLGLQNSPPSNVLEQRLNSMNEYFTYSLYENICRSLFEKHKLIFSFLLTTQILFGNKQLKMDQFRYFLAGPGGDIKVPINPTTWINQNAWPDVYKQINGLSTTLSAFKGLDQYFLQKPDQFKVIFDSVNAHEQPLPEYWNKKLNQFQKIMFLKTLRSDKVIPAIQAWITEKMGERFIITPTFDLSKCFKDSSIQTPLIFVLSSGSDPVADFLKFAQESGMGKRIQSISLGQGQGKKAYNMVIDNSQKGGWVLLQNCHLATSWMSQLQRLVDQLHDNMHKDFRLWLTSMPSPSFPVPVLQNGIKMTLQPPQGLRSNLLRTYNNMTDQELKDCKKPNQYKKLLFGFCLFHAIIQDRRKFGPIGWNIAYQFTNEDLTVCKKQLKMLLDQYDIVPYKVINFLGAEINYGGRVTDDKDVRLIKTILKNYIHSDVMRDGCKFSQSGLYISIQSGNLQQYVNYIQSLPLNPSPEAFGLHDNAQITNSQNQTRLLLEIMLSVQPRVTSGSGKSRDEIIEEIAIFVQERTPQPWIIEDIYQRYPTLYEQSMNTVLIQELIRYNRLLQIMISSIRNGKKALKGLIVMSDELQKMCNSLFDQQVPKIWADVGFLSMKSLGSWTQDLIDRIKFLQGWIDGGTPNVFWISGFFFPQAFITGTLQNYARKYVIAVDRIDFEVKVLDTMTFTQVKQKPENGCYIYGIYLQGARWDSKKHYINTPYPKQLFSDLPMIHLQPIEDRKAPTEGVYNCPLYKVESRRGTLSTTGHSTNFVMFMQLSSKQVQDIWIRAGVAAFLSLRY